jgi:hypothetical protein
VFVDFVFGFGVLYEWYGKGRSLSSFFSNLFGFLSVLLIKKWFTEIVLVYLPVGHTYKKVDGILFAKIGKLKKTQKCETLAKFKSFVVKAFKCTPWNPEVDKNMLVWDWKT